MFLKLCLDVAIFWLLVYISLKVYYKMGHSLNLVKEFNIAIKISEQDMNHFNECHECNGTNNGAVADGAQEQLHLT